MERAFLGYKRCEITYVVIQRLDASIKDWSLKHVYIKGPKITSVNTPNS